MADSVNDIRAKTSATFEPVPGIVVAQTTSSSSAPSPATSLPLSPTEAQQTILVDSTSAPTYVWLLQYSGAAGKWLFLGGSDMYSETTGPATSTSTTYTDTTPALPSVTIPRAGTYAVTFGGEKLVANNTAATTIREVHLAPKIGAASTSDNDDVTFGDNASNTTLGDYTGSRTVTKTFAAADVCKLQIRTGNASSQVAWFFAWLRVRPIAIT